MHDSIHLNRISQNPDLSVKRSKLEYNWFSHDEPSPP